MNPAPATPTRIWLIAPVPLPDPLLAGWERATEPG